MSALSPTSSPSSFIQRISSVGLTVGDVDRSLDFYTRVLGFEWVGEMTVKDEKYSQLLAVPNATIRIVSLRLGDECIQLLQFIDLTSQPLPADSRSNDLWFQHLAIVVSDMDRAYAQLKPFLTVAISTAPQILPASNLPAAGIRAFKFKDPDGHNLELIWYPAGKGQDKWQQPTDRLFLGIDHSAITVADTEQSLGFYCDLLGIPVEGGSLNEGVIQAQLDGLPVAKVQITALRPTDGGMGIELLDYLIPIDERPRPKSWHCNDLGHLHLEIVVSDIAATAAQLRQQGRQFISSRTGQWPSFLAGDRPGFMVKDPNGHALLFVAA